MVSKYNLSGHLFPWKCRLEGSFLLRLKIFSGCFPFDAKISRRKLLVTNIPGYMDTDTLIRISPGICENLVWELTQSHLTILSYMHLFGLFCKSTKFLWICIADGEGLYLLIHNAVESTGFQMLPQRNSRRPWKAWKIYSLPPVNMFPMEVRAIITLHHLQQVCEKPLAVLKSG